MKCVLLDGFLDNAKYERAYAEIERAGDEKICLIVSSFDGGSIVPTLDFIELVKAADLDRNLMVKIYNACSAAGLVATSLGQSREMLGSAVLMFHHGTITGAAAVLGFGGAVPSSTVTEFSRFNNHVLAAMARVGVTDDAHLSTYQNTGMLWLSADECLRLGVVQSLV